MSQGPETAPDALPWSRLIGASERLAGCKSMDQVVGVLRETAREIVGSDGITVVVREADQCFYAAEDSDGPLFKGMRFPLDACVSGWAITHRETVAITDIRLDDRVPQEAYSQTFVRSMVMVPVGSPEPVAAIGAYWTDVREADRSAIERLEALGRSAAIAIENARLLSSVQESDRLRSMAVTAGRMGVWSLDLRTEVLTTSATCRINFGREPDADFPYQALRAAVHPDDQERVGEAIARSIGQRVDYDVEYRLITPAGAERWILIRAQPTYDADGTPLTLAGVSIDVTERKAMEAALRDMTETLERKVAERTAELEHTQEALRQSQKLEAMGQLTGGVAHDFNNLLTPILGSLDLLHRRKIGGEREQRLIEGALQSADRAKTLVQRLLAFARRQPISPTAVDITALLIDLSPLIGSTLGPQVAFKLDIAEDLGSAIADQNQVEMAILNLAVNAHDAMPEGGTLVLAAANVSVGADDAAPVSPGKYVLISVADYGVGMSEETRRRAIEPFYSTKGVGQGTGLGLSMVHGLAIQLSGGLAVFSSPGRGTTIELWLPWAEAIGEAPAAPKHHEIQSGRVLLVDDEDVVRASTADMLIDLGFDVLEARSGEEALDVIASKGPIDLLITDHMMPGITGADLARIVQHRHPNMGILIASGYADVVGLPPDLPRLEKPFRQSDLIAKLAAQSVGRLQTATASLTRKT